MAFTDLSASLQNLLLVNFEFFAKVFLISICLFSALVYLFYFRPRQKRAVFYLSGLIRGLSWGLSWIVLFSLPFTVFGLSPQVSWEVFLFLMIGFYSVAIVVAFAFLYINLLMFGPKIIISFIEPQTDERIRGAKKFMDNVSGEGAYRK